MSVYSFILINSTHQNGGGIEKTGIEKCIQRTTHQKITLLLKNMCKIMSKLPTCNEACLLLEYILLYIH